MSCLQAAPLGRSARPWILFLSVLAVGLTLCGDVGVARGQTTDRVIGFTGSLSGKVVGTSPNGIDIEDRSGDIKKVSIDKVREVQFAGEPSSLRSARSFLLRGRAADVLEELAKVEDSELDGVEPAVLEEMKFVKAAATGRVAVETGEKLAEADAMVADFLAKNPKSHHTYEMQQLLGDIRAKAGKLNDAATAYSVLAKGPPAFKVRAATAKAGLFLDQGKFADAIKEYENAIGIEAGDDASLAQKRSAELGKARALSGLGKHAEAIAVVQKIVKEADPEEKDLLGRAHTVLGAAYRSMGGKDQDALISYLTVDLVYSAPPESHAEALYNLAELWENAKNPERARQARESLKSAYPSSAWAKKLAGAEKAS